VDPELVDAFVADLSNSTSTDPDGPGAEAGASTEESS
jgi:hypothetical protein